MAIRLKRPEDIEKMRQAGRIVAQVHQLCRRICKPGVTTKEIDEAAGQLIADLGDELTPRILKSATQEVA